MKQRLMKVSATIIFAATVGFPVIGQPDLDSRGSETTPSSIIDVLGAYLANRFENLHGAVHIDHVPWGAGITAMADGELTIVAFGGLGLEALRLFQSSLGGDGTDHAETNHGGDGTDHVLSGMCTAPTSIIVALEAHLASRGEILLGPVHVEPLPWRAGTSPDDGVMIIGFGGLDLDDLRQFAGALGGDGTDHVLSGLCGVFWAPVTGRSNEPGERQAQ